MLTYAALYGVAEAMALLRPDLFAWTWTAAPWADTALGAAGAAVVCAASWVFSTRTRRGRALARDLAVVLRGMPGWAVPIVAASAGVAEEALFRGAAWTLVDGLAGAPAALAVTSVLFGAAHGLFTRRFAAWSVFALASGLVLGGLRIATGGLLAPVVAHVLIDAVNVPAILYRLGPGDPDA
ncbi:MAG: CPBP family intramembrane metalloprotease [Deltaproteobacteria bacterium]|nr:CPBP family intramembrane metalloprotease [Deltaproteobacteria bacterium]